MFGAAGKIARTKFQYFHEYSPVSRPLHGTHSLCPSTMIIFTPRFDSLFKTAQDFIGDDIPGDPCNAQPSPQTKIVSSGTRESEQHTRVAKGC